MKKFAMTTLLGAMILFVSIGDIMAADGSITIKGSTTVLPIAQATSEAFMDDNPNVNISVQGGGSSVGIASIIDGTTDIGDASRPIKDKELGNAVANGISPKAHVIAMDGIAVVVHLNNSANNLTKEEIKNIYTGKISNWSEVGSNAGKIVVISRDSASGTFEAFTEKALDGAKTRPDALLQASNQAVAQTVLSTPGAIGYLGLGYITDNVKPVAVNGIECSKNTVLSGKYPLARPLFMYTNGVPKGIVAEYISFILSEEGQRIAEEQGYVGLK